MTTGHDVITIKHKAVSDKYYDYIYTFNYPSGRAVEGVGRMLGLWVRIPPRVQMSVSCEYFVLSGSGLCVELITRPEESYQVWCVP